jgi:DNA polymerase-3 subunit delta'
VAEEESDILAPRANPELVGHEAAEAALLQAHASGRLPQALLIAGPRGIGKATLAYRLARFLLAQSMEEGRGGLFGAPPPPTSLALAPEHPVFRRVAASGHADLLTVERAWDPRRKKLRSEIVIDDTRAIAGFLRLTPAEGGWRIVIVDGADEMNRNAANALLKVLEEPPRQSLFLLVSHAPARVLPTIQSRCRKLTLRPLATDHVIRAAAEAARISPDDASLREAADASEGSVARALSLVGGGALKLHQQTRMLLDSLPQVDPRELHALGDALGGSDRAALGAFVDSVDRWIGERLRAGDANTNLPRLARLAEVWEKINNAARETETYNLERKPLVFSVFGLLAEATR